MDSSDEQAIRGRVALGGALAMAAAAAATASLTLVGPVDAWIVGVGPEAAGVPAALVPFSTVPVAFLAGLLVWGIGVDNQGTGSTPIFDGPTGGVAAAIVALLLAVVVLVPGWLFLRFLPAIGADSPLALRSALPLLATLPQFWLQLIVFPLAGYLYERQRPTWKADTGDRRNRVPR